MAAGKEVFLVKIDMVPWYGSGCKGHVIRGLHFHPWPQSI